MIFATQSSQTSPAVSISPSHQLRGCRLVVAKATEPPGWEPCLRRCLAVLQSVRLSIDVKLNALPSTDNCVRDISAPRDADFTVFFISPVRCAE